MKVYISCHDRESANELASTLTDAGHSIVSTWHTSAEPRPDRNDVKAWCRNSAGNFGQIRGADALVLVAGPDKYPGGKFVEAGYAYANGVRVFVLGRRENGMVALFGFAEDSNMLLAFLGNDTAANP